MMRAMKGGDSREANQQSNEAELDTAAAIKCV